MADDSASNASSSNSTSWITKLQQRQEQLAENRAELRRLLQYKREVTDEEKKGATMAQLLASNNKVPGDEWRARLEASERHLAATRLKHRKQPSPESVAEQQQQQMQRPQSVGARATAAPSGPTSAATAAAGVSSAAAAATAAYSTSDLALQDQQQKQQQQHSMNVGGSVTFGSSDSPSQQNQNQKKIAPASSSSPADEAAIRIQLAKDHVKYIEAIHVREDAIRSKSQRQREHALLNEIVAAREECKRHVDSADLACRNQEDLLRVISLLKQQLEDSVKELEYARKEIDFTGREALLKRDEVRELRIELALTQKRLEKAEKAVQKRDAALEVLEREKMDVLLDCKKVIKERKVAEEELEGARRDATAQRQAADEWKRDALVPPAYRRGQPAPMVYEAHRRASPSHYAACLLQQQQQQQPQELNNNIKRPSSAGSRITHSSSYHSSSSPLASQQAAAVVARDTALLRDLFADLASCPLLRKAVRWDTARAGASALPIVFDRQSWEEVKRDLTSQPSSSRTPASPSFRVASRHEQLQQPQPYSGAKTSDTTCRRCGHQHHCHHTCSHCTGHNLASVVPENTHTKTERAYAVRTQSPNSRNTTQNYTRKATSSFAAVDQQRAAVSSGAEASDEFTASETMRLRNDAPRPQRQHHQQQQQQQQQQRGAAPDAVSSSSSDDDVDENGEKDTTVTTRSSVGAPFRKLVAAHDNAAREARRGRATLL